MWDSISKPAQYVGSSINDFFEVQFAALPHFEERHDDFVADTIVLRRRCACLALSLSTQPHASARRRCGIAGRHVEMLNLCFTTAQGCPHCR